MTELREQPSKPFLLMNDHFICEFGRGEWSETITTETFYNPKLLQNMIIIDSECKKSAFAAYPWEI